jgi:hypothetical protein
MSASAKEENWREREPERKARARERKSERDSLSLRARVSEKFFSFRVKINRNCYSDISKARIQSILPSF